MKLVMVSEEFKNEIIESLSHQFPSPDFEYLLESFVFYKTSRKDVFIIQNSMIKDIQRFNKFSRKLSHIGIYLGRYRKQFDLSVEFLSLLPKRFFENSKYNDWVMIEENDLAQKFLSNEEIYFEEVLQLKSKLFVLDEYYEVLGIGKAVVKDNITYIKPLVDIGSYLRSQNELFGKRK